MAARNRRPWPRVRVCDPHRAVTSGRGRNGGPVGRLTADVMKDPERYVEFDSELPLTLLDQREAGKKLALITNSDWEYTKTMMHQVMDRYRMCSV